MGGGSGFGGIEGRGGAGGTTTLCDDTCMFASDGECDDCATGSTSSICKIGTDCIDCGAARQTADQCTDPCDQCLQENCMTYTNACIANSDCIDLLSCVTDCIIGDTTCVSTCTETFPNGVTGLTDLLNCQTNSCSIDCV